VTTEPLQAAGAAVLRLAWRHRDTLTVLPRYPRPRYPRPGYPRPWCPGPRGTIGQMSMTTSSRTTWNASYQFTVVGE